MKRHPIECAQAHADAQAGRAGAHRRDRLTQEARAALEISAIAPRALNRAQKLMTEIAMTVLDVHECEACALSDPGRAAEVCDEASNRVVAEHRVIGRQVELAVEPGVMVQDSRLQPLLVVGPGEAPRVCELQTDQQIVAPSEARFVLPHQRLTQRREPAERGFVRDELVGVRTPIMAHGDGFAAPDKFRATRAEALPAPQRQVARLPVRRRVPALHRQNRKTIARALTIHDKRLRQRL